MSFKEGKFVPPYVVVECDGSSLNTHVYNVSENGVKTEIHNVMKAEFEVEAGKVPKLVLTVACPKIVAKVKKAATKKCQA
ncbi:Uncharacterised protein [uncultured archaeon]|nr:Uncharacterised protein [uncultured archaeon]